MTDRAGPRPVLILILLLLVAIAARAQTYGNPVIEFDEQFYRMIGERMLHGALPYVDIWDRKPIGLFLPFALAAWIGGEHALSYQIMATLFAALTGWTIFLIGRRISGDVFGPLVAALLYILWLNLLQGEGGQSPVLYNLPMCAAAALVPAMVYGKEGRAFAFGGRGMLAMLLVGIAVQMKYTAIVEGGYFGAVALLAMRRAGMSHGRLVLIALGYGALVLLPTAAAWLVYALLGHGQEWFFANIQSVFLRSALPLSELWGDFATGLGTIVLLIVAAVAGVRSGAHPVSVRQFLAGWAIVAAVAILALRSFQPHYMMPLLPPLLLLAAPAFSRWRRLTLTLAVAGAVAGQIVVGYLIYLKGDQRTVANMRAAIGPLPHCLYLFDGFPALYQEVNSCLPGRFVFPGHLNSMVEEKALGIDPETEVRRILATKPDAIVVDDPVWNMGNARANAIVRAELRRNYRLVLAERTGKDRYRLVYRINSRPLGD